MSYLARSMKTITRAFLPLTFLNRSYPILQYEMSCGSATNISKRWFKSDLHTDNLYPGSKVSDRFKVVDPTSLVKSSATFSGVIPVKELDIRYSGSSAPGGQNVNKSATKVEARFNLESASWLSAETKDVLKEKWEGQLTKDGYFVVKSERTRSQLLNQVYSLNKIMYVITFYINFRRGITRN